MSDNTDIDPLVEIVAEATGEPTSHEEQRAIIAIANPANRAAVLKALGLTWERRYLPVEGRSGRVPRLRWVSDWEDVTDE